MKGRCFVKKRIEYDVKLFKRKVIQSKHVKKLDQGTWLMPHPPYKVWEEKGSYQLSD